MTEIISDFELPSAVSDRGLKKTRGSLAATLPLHGMNGELASGSEPSMCVTNWVENINIYNIKINFMMHLTTLIWYCEFVDIFSYKFGQSL